MDDSELHARACLWSGQAALIVEGEARDPLNGGDFASDALHRVTPARGLRLTTDLDRLDRRPVPGWWIRIEHDGGVTLRWPRFAPLLQHAPLGMPDDWLDVAHGNGLVVVFVGYGLGMCEHVDDAICLPAVHLPRAAETGALASGAVPVVGRFPAPLTSPARDGPVRTPSLSSRCSGTDRVIALWPCPHCHDLTAGRRSSRIPIRVPVVRVLTSSSASR